MQKLNKHSITAYIDCEANDHSMLPFLPSQSTLFVAFGNEHIRHTTNNGSATEIAQAELAKRATLVSAIMPKATVLPGGLNNQDSCDAFVSHVRSQLGQPQTIIHTASFKPLQSSFNQVDKSALSGVDIITYARQFNLSNSRF